MKKPVKCHSQIKAPTKPRKLLNVGILKQKNKRRKTWLLSQCREQIGEHPLDIYLLVDKAKLVRIALCYLQYTEL